MNPQGDIPEPRYSFAMENMGSGNIVVYGGKQN